ncbi:hypothetical protein D0864_11755, partial [Hortaea werneckii]
MPSARAEWWRRVGSEVASGDLQPQSNGIASRGPSQTAFRSKETLQESPGSGGETEKDDFQRQSTPPTSKRSVATLANGERQETQRVASSFTQEREESEKVATEAAPDDESTEDEEDLDAPANKPSQPASRQESPKRKPAVPEGPFSPPSKSAKTAQSPLSTTKPRSRLGAIGGKRDTVSSVSTSPENVASTDLSASAQAPAERTASS